MKKLYTLNKLANEISSESLFTRGGTLHPTQIKNVFAKSWKYCTGKYSTSNKNQEIKNNPDIPIWYITRSDKYGSYLQLMNVDKDILNDDELKIYTRILSIWKSL